MGVEKHRYPDDVFNLLNRPVPVQTDIRPPYVSEMVHYAQSDGSCWAAVVTLVHELGDRQVALTAFPPFAHSSPPVFTTRGVIFEGSRRLPGTWHHVDSPVHRQ